MLSSFLRPFRGSPRAVPVAALLLLLAIAPVARAAEVRIDISKAPTRRIKIAQSPLMNAALSEADSSSLTAVLKSDLEFSGFFQVTTQFPASVNLDGIAAAARPELFDKIAAQGMELLLSLYDRSEAGHLIMEVYVFDLSTKQQLFGKRYRGPEGSGVKVIRVMAGEIIRELTGVQALATGRLAFLWNISGKKQVYVGDYDGRDPKPLSPPGQLALFPSWLPDGRSLVYTSFAGGFPELVYHDIITGHEKTMASFPGMNATASFSPDGQNFLITLSKDGNPEIYKMDLRGSIVKRLTYDQAVDTSPAYAPSGRSFAFVSDRGGNPQIYTLGVEGGKPSRISFYGGYNVSPDWSPSGKFIVYSSRIDKNFQLVLTDNAGGETTLLTSGPGDKEDPSWGPDDRHVVFTLTKGQKSDLFMVDVHSRELTQLTKGKGDFTSPSWSR